jgi:hypothetical protein
VHRRQQQQPGEQSAPEGKQRAAQVLGPVAEQVGFDEQSARAPEQRRQQNEQPAENWLMRRRNGIDCRIAHDTPAEISAWIVFGKVPSPSGKG